MILVDAQLVSPFLFIVGSLLSLVVVVFSVGAYGLEHHVFVASDSDTDSDSFPCVSLYFNLYVVIVASYITIRVYTLFVDPMFQSLSSKLYYGGGPTGTPSSVRSVTDAQTKNRNTNTYTSSDDGIITAAKEQQRKGNSTNITTTHHQQEQDQEQVQNQQDGNNEKTTMVLNMTGNYQLVSHENFEEFLGTQGVPKMFQGLACKSRPIHRIVHTKRNHRTPTTTTIETNPQQYDTVSIKAEGIVDTYVEYNLDGPAIVTKIKGKPYEDTMTYLTYEEMGIPPPGLPPPTTPTTSPTDTNGGEATKNSADTGDEDDDYSSTDSISADADASASASSEDGGSEEEEAETVVSSATLNMNGEFIDQESSTSFDILKQKMLAQFTEGGNLRTSKVKRLIRRSSKKAKKGKKNQNCTAAPSTLPPSKKKETPGLTTTTTTAAENDEHTVVNSDVTEDDGTTMTTKNTNNNTAQIYCGVKNIKRQHEEKYTLIVQRYVHTNQTKIDMILHVKYDDPNKKNVIAKQYYERI